VAVIAMRWLLPAGYALIRLAGHGMGGLALLCAAQFVFGFTIGLDSPIEMGYRIARAGVASQTRGSRTQCCCRAESCRRCGHSRSTEMNSVALLSQMCAGRTRWRRTRSTGQAGPLGRSAVKPAGQVLVTQAGQAVVRSACQVGWSGRLVHGFDV
jgi:hypothetical protein